MKFVSKLIIFLIFYYHHHAYASSDVSVNLATIIKQEAFEKHFSKRSFRKLIEDYRKLFSSSEDPKSEPIKSYPPDAITIMGQVEVKPINDSYVNCSAYTWMEKRIHDLNENALNYAEEIYTIALTQELENELSTDRLEEINAELDEIESEFSVLADQVYFNIDRAVIIRWNLKDVIDIQSLLTNSDNGEVHFEWHDKELNASSLGFWNRDMQIPVEKTIPRFQSRGIYSRSLVPHLFLKKGAKKVFGYEAQNHYPKQLTIVFHFSAQEYCTAQNQDIELKVLLEIKNGLLYPPKQSSGNDGPHAHHIPNADNHGDLANIKVNRPKPEIPRPVIPGFGSIPKVCPNACTPPYPKGKISAMKPLSSRFHLFGKNNLEAPEPFIILKQNIIFSAVIGEKDQ